MRRVLIGVHPCLSVVEPDRSGLEFSPRFPDSMQKVACSFCGLPFSVYRAEPGVDYFCCSGCALASRIPLGTRGQFPVSAGLIVALAFAFGLFNQFLFGVLGSAVIDEGRVEVGARLQLVAIILGGAIVLVGTAFALVSRGRSGGDAIIAPLVLVICGWFAWVAWRLGPGLVTAPFFATNLVLALWLARGWFWRAYAKRRRS